MSGRSLASGPLSQALFEAISRPLLSRIRKTGWASAPVTPKPVRAGPTARARYCLPAVSLTTTPVIRTLSPAPTKPRLERLARRGRGVSETDFGPPTAELHGLEGTVFALALGR